MLLDKWLKIPWTTRRINHSILHEGKQKCSLVVLMMKLNFKYFRHIMQKARLIGKDPGKSKTIL